VLEVVDGGLDLVSQLASIGELNHRVGCRLSEIPVEDSTDVKRFLEVTTCFLVKPNLLMSVGDHHMRAHDFIVHLW
jgi:hypothetical protein